jgi:N-acetylglucosaminyl-diphospho-decaprenol L-rhamnosyltransferase
MPTSHSSRRIGVIIVSYNSSEELERCLTSLETEDVVPLVWDNGSRPDEQVATIGLCSTKGVFLHSSDVNLGFGKAVNVAVELLLKNNPGLDYIWILNPDVVISEDSASLMIQGMEENKLDLASPLILTRWQSGETPRIWFSGGHVYPKSGRTQHISIGRPMSSVNGDLHASTFLSGAALMVEVNSWIELGGFQEELFLYHEDTEICLRASARGYRMGTLLGVTVHHDEGASSAGSGPGPVYYYYVHRNRMLLFGSRYGHLNILVGKGATETIRLFANIVRRPSGLFWQSLRASFVGIFSGIRGEIGEAPFFRR